MNRAGNRSVRILVRNASRFVLASGLLASLTVAGAQSQRLAVDTPRSTALGATFIAPAGWLVEVKGPATILEAPEGDSHIALIDVRAADADAAVKAAWAAYRPNAPWALKVVTPRADGDGWTDRRQYQYETSPNERRDVTVFAMRSADVWTIVIDDMSQPTAEKRLAQVQLILGRLMPNGS